MRHARRRHHRMAGLHGPVSRPPHDRGPGRPGDGRPVRHPARRRLSRIREPPLPGRGPRSGRARRSDVQVVARQRVHRDQCTGDRCRPDRADGDPDGTRRRPPVQHRRLGRGDRRRARAVRPAGRHAQGRACRRRRVDGDAHDGTAGRHVRRDRPASSHPDQALGSEGDRPRRRPECRGRRRHERRRHQGPGRGHDARHRGRDPGDAVRRSRRRQVPVRRLLGVRRSDRGRVGRRAGQGSTARDPPPLLPARDPGLQRQGRP